MSTIYSTPFSKVVQDVISRAGRFKDLNEAQDNKHYES